LRSETRLRAQPHQSRPLWNPPARATLPLEHLNGQILLSGCFFMNSELFHDVRSADLYRNYTSGKKSEHFLSEQD
jgi:hypothetical protein